MVALILLFGYLWSRRFRIIDLLFRKVCVYFFNAKKRLTRKGVVSRNTRRFISERNALWDKYRALLVTQNREEQPGRVLCDWLYFAVIVLLVNSSAYIG